MGWSGINVEPDPITYDKLVNNRPTAINLNVGLSNNIGSVEFTKAIHPTMGEHFGNGSITHQQNHIEGLVNEGCTFRKFNIETITYKELLQYVPGHIDLMVLDVEGHELAVLNGMMDAAILPNVMCVEHGNLDSRALTDYMQKLGYIYDFSKFNNSFYRREAAGLPTPLP